MNNMFVRYVQGEKTARGTPVENAPRHAPHRNIPYQNTVRGLTKTPLALLPKHR